MAIPYVILDGNLDRATRVRLAVLTGCAMDESARLINREDLEGYGNELLRDLELSVTTFLYLANGNGKNISDEVFTKIMKWFNCYL